MMFNSTAKIRDYGMPEVGRGMRWNLLIDTAAESPDDIDPDINDLDCDAFDEIVVTNGHIGVLDTNVEYVIVQGEGSALARRWYQQ